MIQDGMGTMKTIRGQVRIQKVKGFPNLARYSLSVVCAVGLSVKFRGKTDNLYTWQRDSPVTEDFLAQKRVIAFTELLVIVMPSIDDCGQSTIFCTETMF
jgi:hypothetical protein